MSHHKAKRFMMWGQGFPLWRTLWINENGSLKVKTSFQLPKVQNHFNRAIDLPDIPMNFYKDVEVGDMDYYGWFCIDIVQIMSFTNNPDIGIEYLTERYNKTVYSKLRRNHRQRAYRDRMKKHQW